MDRQSYISLNFGWAIGLFRTVYFIQAADLLFPPGLALAVWTSAGISGGHVNPAVGPKTVSAMLHYLNNYSDHSRFGHLEGVSLEESTRYVLHNSLLTHPSTPNRRPRSP